ncbi:hypothetical protein FACS1894111_03680 [Clostridia bacterium]|nr:hypothetical protein FACS1894111_03680 [Clostridia bacterium]
MKAWVLHGINDMKQEAVAEPVLHDGEVLVQVKAAGICSSDISRVYVNGAYHYPIILGHEFSGVTMEGRRVGVFPLLPCFTCDSCRQNRYETCSNYGYIGSRQNGAFAESVAVPKWNLMDLPDTLSFEHAAMLEPASVALHAVKHFDLTNVNTAAVVGNGTIGRLIAKWLNIYGVEKVSVIGRNDNTPQNMDACIEAVGSVDALKRCIDAVRPNGQIVLVGNPNAEFGLEQKLYWQILRKQLILRGSWNGSFRVDWQETMDNIDQLDLDELISHRFSFNELDKAVAMMKNKTERYSKVMIRV